MIFLNFPFLKRFRQHFSLYALIITLRTISNGQQDCFQLHYKRVATAIKELLFGLQHLAHQHPLHTALPAIAEVTHEAVTLLLNDSVAHGNGRLKTP